MSHEPCACAPVTKGFMWERVSRHRIPLCAMARANAMHQFAYISFVLLQINQFICWQVELSHERNMRKLYLHTWQWCGYRVSMNSCSCVCRCGMWSTNYVFYWQQINGIAIVSVSMCAYGKTCRSSPLCSRYKLRCVEIRCVLCCCRQVIDMCQNHFMSFKIQMVTHFSQHYRMNRADTIRYIVDERETIFSYHITSSMKPHSAVTQIDKIS